MFKDKTTGQRIKYFRQRYKISQFELENKIGLSSGTISRIENDQINPTKETLFKIVKALYLKSYEASTLFNIDAADDIAKVLKITNELSVKTDVKDIMQSSANSIAAELNLLGVGIFLVKGDMVIAETYTKTWYTEKSLKLLQKPLNAFMLSLKDNTTSLVVKAINERQSVYTENLVDVMKPIGNVKLWKVAQKIINLKSMLLYPIYFENTPLGALVFAKNYKDNFEYEMPVFKAFAEHIAIIVTNAQKHNAVMAELEKLKKQKSKN